MKRFSPALVALILLVAGAVGQENVLRSPNGKLEVRIKTGKTVTFSLNYAGQRVLTESAIGMTIAERPAIGIKPKIVGRNERSFDENVTAVVPARSRNIRDHFNELTLTFEGGYGLIWRAYDNGTAFRWTTELPGKITVTTERFDINTESKASFFYPEETDFYSHNERTYFKYSAKQLRERLASLPLLAFWTDGPRLWISEADLHDYAGMWVRGTKGKGVKAVFPAVAASEVMEGDRELKVTGRAGYIAKTEGKRAFPWRVLGIAGSDKELLNNDLVFLLSPPSSGDFSWVRPGKVAWDWWNAYGLEGVPFKPGLNTATFKYYIDFAAKNGLQYVIMDEFWSSSTDPTKVNPEINLADLVAYARARNVGIIAWIIWVPLEKNMAAILDQYSKWGLAGIKVDFMQRDDQRVVNFYENVAREAAKRKLLVEFHGSHKPTGLSRTYPNVLSYEGVLGLEHNKFFKTATPDHDVTLPFTRMVAGPMDYTPGAMRNGSKESFVVSNERPMSQGTRAHQLAMYVVFESPLQMLSDSPTTYEKEPISMEFLGPVPSVWEETVPLDGKAGEYVAVARKGLQGDWYLGAMTGWPSRELALSLSFLGDGEYEAHIYQDGPDAARTPTDLQRIIKPVKKGDVLKVKMAPGGGFAARIIKK